MRKDKHGEEYPTPCHQCQHHGALAMDSEPAKRSYWGMMILLKTIMINVAQHKPLPGRK